MAGNVCESNTSKTFCTPRNGFEDRGAHRSPSVPKCGGILPNRAANLAQGAQAAGLLVEHREAHGIQVFQDADGTFARHTQGLAQGTRGGSTAGSLDSDGNELARMGLGGSGQGNVALDLNDRAVERKLAQGTLSWCRDRAANCSPTSGSVGASRPTSSSKATIRSQASRTTRAAAAAECGSNTSAPSAAHTPREQPSAISAAATVSSAAGQAA